MEKKNRPKKLIAVMVFTALIVTLAFSSGVSSQIEASGLAFGTQVGTYNGVIAYSNYDDDYASDEYNYKDDYNTGMKWQCVEYVNRYYYDICGQEIRISGTNADGYYDAASDRGLVAYPNGGTTSPQPGDILCSNGGTHGHVAIVREVTADSVHVIHQNWANTAVDNDKTISMSVSGGHYTVSGFSSKYPVQGWIRKAGGTIIPLTADLNGNGTDTTGIYNTSTAEFTFAGKTVRFGTTTDIPVTGDWDGDGYDELGIFRPKVEGFEQSTSYLVTRNWSDLPYEVGAADKTIPFGYYPDDIPLAGDWDGDGDDDVGGYYPANSTFYLYLLNLDSSTASSFKDVSFGQSGDSPITGDWDCDGDDDVGVFRSNYPPNTNSFYLDLGLTGGQHELGPYELGDIGDKPVAGDWDGDGGDNLGVYRPSENKFYPRPDLPTTPTHSSVHNMNTCEDFTTIQAAIEDADTHEGHTILVDSGTYCENVNVTKELILRGVDNGGGMPVVDAQENGIAITLSADGITLKGFNAANAPNAGIYVTSDNNIITSNSALNNGIGIWLNSSSNTTLNSNIVLNNYYGIYMEYSAVTNEGTTQLTSSSLWQSGPAWSPDGTKIVYTKIVYASDESGSRDIWIMNADGSNKIQLTTDTKTQSLPTWSPDGTKIVYASDESGNRDIWIMNADGSNKIQLTTDTKTQTHPTWSPDGTKIVYEISSGSYETHNVDIWIMNADGTEKTPLTSGAHEERSYSLSRTGKIAYEKYMGDYNWDIWVMELDGSNKKQLTTDPSQENAPLISPDGSKIAYSNGGIWIMNSDGSNKKKLSTGSVGVRKASWSPDGTKIAYIDGNNPFGIFVINDDGTGKTQLTTGATYAFCSIWSPDGTKIAYVTAKDASLSGEANIWVMTLGGSNRIYHNNIINNANQAYDNTGTNLWDNEYPSGGNYWSDYMGSDAYSGPDQNVPGGDDIGDMPYDISGGAGAQDNYPFMQANGWIATSAIFDTLQPDNPYPSIPGTYIGTITPSQDIAVQKLYTYSCAGTGGHTEYARIWNSTLNVTAKWDGYKEDWHNLSFKEPFSLVAGEEYNYCIRTGSYPQIHHESELPTANGWLNCTQFTDANGKKHDNWIPAIKLEGDKKY